MPAPDHGDISAVLDRKANEDATAVREFAGNHRIADSVIGFHAQQAIEKWLKAVIAATGRKVERTHDLDLLIEKARDAGRELSVDADRVTALIQYAVPFRYDDLLNSDPLDRDDAVALVESVGVWARGWLARS